MKWNLDLTIAKKLYDDMGDEQWKRIVDFLAALTPAELFEIGFHYDYSKVIKLGSLMKLGKMLESIVLE